MAPIIAREVVEIPAGRYNGTIISAKVEPSTRKSDGRVFDYLNLRIDTGRRDIKGWDGVTRCSLSANLSNLTDLGRLLTRLGLSFEPNKAFDEKSLEGMNVSFDMVREDNFTNVVISTISLTKK